MDYQRAGDDGCELFEDLAVFKIGTGASWRIEGLARFLILNGVARFGVGGLTSRNQIGLCVRRLCRYGTQTTIGVDRLGASIYGSPPSRFSGMSAFGPTPQGLAKSFPLSECSRGRRMPMIIGPPE